MAIWTNADGLHVKFDRSIADKSRGGEVNRTDVHEIQFEIDYTDALSATAAIVKNGDGLGIQVPKGARIESLEIVVQTPFTSSGTIGSSTLVIGTKKWSDLSTELDHDGFTTTSFVAGVLDAAGERTYVVPGVTGAGDDYGTTFAENGVIVVANSAHASHPYTAGRAFCRLRYYIPMTTLS